MKKAQLKIQQMAFMLIAVVLFFIFAGLFFIGVRYATLQRDVAEAQLEEAFALVTKIAETPEFRCSASLGSYSNCIDADKMMALKEIDVYEGFWPVESIVITKLYPETEEVECTKTNYPNCNQIKIFTSSGAEPVSTYVALCRKTNIEGIIYDKCEMAILMVGFEYEQ